MVTTARYHSLDCDEIDRTLARLHSRITERFPESGLRKVCEELLAVGEETKGCVTFLQSPHWVVRGFVGAVIVGTLVVVLLAVRLTLQIPAGTEGRADVIQAIDATASSAVFVGFAILFLFSLEPRLKRRHALKVAHKLRSLAHVIDMHQLTKDPERLLSPETPDTSSSPERNLTPPELGRYLDYCSELLSVASKLAALLVQYFDDPVLLGAVDEIETLSTGLSGKIWQKIQMLDSGRIPV